MTEKDIIIIVLYLIVGYRIIFTAVRNIFNGVIFDENFLMVVASIGSMCLGEFDEALMVMLLYRIGEFLQDRAVDKSRRSISDLMDIRPDYANLQQGGDYVKVAPEKVAAGDVILIKPGERVPLDGVIIEGSSRLDTAAISGESLPVDAFEGSEINSGTVNLDAAILVRVNRAAADSTASRILELVENAAESRGAAEKFITKFAGYYTPAVCGLALLLAVLPPLLGFGPWSTWINRGLIFLVISCPCALVISIPLGFFAGIGGASSKGILIKGGNYLEALSKADTMVFDKTGTLTKGIYKVVAVHPHEMSEDELLRLAAYAESFSDHPIARSLAEAYGKKIDKSIISESRETAGRGISAKVGGIYVTCGNSHLMQELGADYHECHVAGTAVHIIIDGEYAGHIIISDVVKDDSKAALAELRKLGVKKLVMLTGDKKAISDKTAEELAGLDEAFAEMMPADKLEKTKALMSESKKLAFVGDGINDAPSLTLADIGIAMGGMGTAAAVEAADVVLMNDRPSDIALCVRIARKTMNIIYQNIVFSIGIKVLVLILSAFGITNMWLAMFADVGVCLLAVLNSMRALAIR